jgi:hypothetical protein
MKIPIRTMPTVNSRRGVSVNGMGFGSSPNNSQVSVLVRKRQTNDKTLYMTTLATLLAAKDEGGAQASEGDSAKMSMFTKVKIASTR